MTSRDWSPAAVRGLCATTARTDLVTACEIVLGCSRTKAYELYRRDELPFSTLRSGNRIVVPTAQLLHLLGLTHEDNGAPRTQTAVAGQ